MAGRFAYPEVVTVTTIQGKTVDAAGNPLVGTRVTIDLIAGDAQDPGYTSTASVVRAVALTSGALGVWSVALTANASITPANTYYRVTEQPIGGRAKVSYISVPGSGGPYELVDVLLADPGEPAVAGITAGAAQALIDAALADIEGSTPSATVVSETTYGQAATAGDDAAFARGDHSHGTPALPSTTDIGAVPTSRQVTAGTGLTGGGTLAADRSFAVSYGSSAGTAAQGNDSRLSDSRTPTAHASSHASAGSDPVSPAAIGAATSGHNHDASYSASGHNHSGAYAALSHAHAGEDVTSGTVAFASLPTGTGSSQVAVGNHSHGGGGGGSQVFVDSGFISNGSSGGDGFTSSGGDGTAVGSNLSITASAGDRLEVTLNAFRADSGGELRIDVATIISGSPNRWFSSGTATKRAGGYGGNYVQTGRFAPVGGPLWHTVNADDIATGQVTVSVRAITDSGGDIVVRANDVFGARVIVKNLGQAS